MAGGFGGSQDGGSFLRFDVPVGPSDPDERTNAIAFPRQVAMYLTRRITRMSLEEIGGYFGGRDHSTVLYAVQKIARVAREDPSCQELIAKLLTDLQTTP
jgi:chromosomal replication initiator protein